MPPTRPVAIPARTEGMTIQLRGTRVLVIGGDGVLGGHLAAQIQERGATVMVAGRNAERVETRVEDLGAAASAVVDLAEPGDASAVIASAVDKLGGLDGVVNAAGVVAFGPLAELADETLDELVAVDLAGPLRVMRAALPHLDGGFFVNLTGVVAEQPTAGLVAYSAVKAGLSAASRALARELRREGVHVLDARPGHTETGLADRPIAGTAPPLPEGMAPEHVARVIVEGLEAGRHELASTDFSSNA